MAMIIPVDCDATAVAGVGVDVPDELPIPPPPQAARIAARAALASIAAAILKLICMNDLLIRKDVQKCPVPATTAIAASPPMLLGSMVAMTSQDERDSLEDSARDAGPPTAEIGL
jgi:hypothetical protein